MTPQAFRDAFVFTLNKIIRAKGFENPTPYLQMFDISHLEGCSSLLAKRVLLSGAFFLIPAAFENLLPFA